MKKLLLSITILIAGISANAQGLVAHYPFNGNANDATGNYNGTVAGATLTTDRFGNPNSAYLFHGGNGIDSINCGYISELDSADQYSISCWVNQNSLGVEAGIWTFWGGPMIQLRTWSDGNLYGYSQGFMGVDYSTVMSANQWHNITTVVDLQQPDDTLKYKIYIDGVQVPITFSGAGPQLVNVINSSAVFAIGSDNPYYVDGNSWAGKLDDFHIYNISLSPTQVDSLYNLPDPTTVNIPDALFKAYLVGNTLINTNNDNEIQVSEAIAFTDTIDPGYIGNVSTIVGIEEFINMKGLVLSGNNPANITLISSSLEYFKCQFATTVLSIDVTGCPNLKVLDLYRTNITSIDVTNNPLLSKLSTDSDNTFPAIDVSQNPLLEFLSVKENELLSIDLSNNPKLTYLDVKGNQISSLAVSNLPDLKYLSFTNNPISSIDISLNTKLESFRASFTKLASLDFSQNDSLKVVWIRYNTQLTDIDLSNCPNLSNVWFGSDSNLVQVNLKNGNNINLANLSGKSCPKLICIQVDDVAYSIANWTNIDSPSLYSASCYTTVGINEQTLNSNITVYPNPTKSQLTISATEIIKKITVLDVTGKMQNMRLQNNNKIDVSDFPSGIYFVQIVTVNGSSISKFIKE